MALFRTLTVHRVVVVSTSAEKESDLGDRGCNLDIYNHALYNRCMFSLL